MTEFFPLRPVPRELAEAVVRGEPVVIMGVKYIPDPGSQPPTLETRVAAAFERVRASWSWDKHGPAEIPAEEYARACLAVVEADLRERIDAWRATSTHVWVDNLDDMADRMFGRKA